MNRDRIFPWKKRKDKEQRTEELQGQNSSETVTEKNDAVDEMAGGDIKEVPLRNTEPLHESLTQKITTPDYARNAKEGKSNFVLTKNIMLVHTDEKITGGR